MKTCAGSSAPGTKGSDNKKSKTKPHVLTTLFSITLVYWIFLFHVVPQVAWTDGGESLLLVYVLGTLLFFVALPVSVLVHELGHALFGSLTGSKVTELNAGPLSIKLIDGRLRFGRVKDPQEYLSGLCRTESKIGPRSKRGYLIEILGGPFVTACLLACGLALVSVPETSTVSWSRIAGLALSLANSFYLLGSTGFRGDPNTDYKLFMAVRNLRDFEGASAVSTVYQRWREGDRARDWNREQIDQGLASDDPRVRSAALIMSYYNYLDSGQSQLSLRDIESHAEIGGSSKKIVVMWEELCFARAFLACDLPGAEQAWENVDKDQADASGAKERALASLALCRGEIERASEHCQLAEDWLKSKENADQANIQAELEWIEAIKAKCEPGSAVTNEEQVAT